MQAIGTVNGGENSFDPASPIKKHRLAAKLGGVVNQRLRISVKHEG
jgi:hypothetical protein